MDDDAKMHLIKKRIIKSYAWQRDIIKPLSKDYNCSGEELEEVLFNLLDMSSLEALHATYVTAQETCLAEKFNADLRLCWFVDTLELISKEDATNLKDKLVKEVMNGKKYDEVLEEGQIEVFQILKSLQ